jgi:hypothetical protein
VNFTCGIRCGRRWLSITLILGGLAACGAGADADGDQPDANVAFDGAVPGAGGAHGIGGERRASAGTGGALGTDFDFRVAVKTTGPLDLVRTGAPGPGCSYTVSPNPGRPLAIDGVTLVGGQTDAIGTNILIANQPNPTENGIFRCAESDAGGTTFYRVEAYDETRELKAGTRVRVTNGAVGRGDWLQTSVDVDVDAAPLTFEAAPGG